MSSANPFSTKASSFFHGETALLSDKKKLPKLHSVTKRDHYQPDAGHCWRYFAEDSSCDWLILFLTRQTFDLAR